MDATEFFTTTLPNLLSFVFRHEVHADALYLSLLLSAGGTAMILKHTGFKFWFDPVPYFLALFLGSYLAHSVVGYLPLPGMAPIGQMLVTTLLGMTAGTLLLLSYMKPDVR